MICERALMRHARRLGRDSVLVVLRRRHQEIWAAMKAEAIEAAAGIG